MAKSKEAPPPGTVAKRGDVLPEPIRDGTPDYLEKYEGDRRGFEASSKEDQYVPMLGLCQSMSPQRKITNSRFIEGLEEGDFFHTVTGRIYGKEIIITPLFKFDTAFRMDEDNNFECRSEDSVNCPKYGKCVSRVWGDDGTPPVCGLVKNVPVVIYGDDLEEYAILGFKSTQLAKFKDFWSKMKATHKPAFVHAFKLSSIPESDDKYQWFGYKIEPFGWAPLSVVEAGEQLHQRLLEEWKAGRLKFNPEDLAGGPGVEGTPDSAREM